MLLHQQLLLLNQRSLPSPRLPPQKIRHQRLLQPDAEEAGPQSERPKTMLRRSVDDSSLVFSLNKQFYLLSSPRVRGQDPQQGRQKRKPMTSPTLFTLTMTRNRPMTWKGYTKTYVLHVINTNKLYTDRLLEDLAPIRMLLRRLQRRLQPQSNRPTPKKPSFQANHLAL